MEELWRNNNRGRTQGFLQWKRAWCWISCSQGHREHCHGMSPSLQQAHRHPREGSPFQLHNSTSTRPNYDQLQNVIDQTPKKDILVVKGDWNAKVGRDTCGNWQGICGPFCNDNTNERGPDTTHLIQRQCCQRGSRAKIQQAIGPYEDLLTIVKSRRL